MGIDLKGMTQGVVNVREDPKIVQMRCRNPKCDSIECFEIVIPGAESSGQRLYKCVKCGQPVTLAVGGSFANF